MKAIDKVKKAVSAISSKTTNAYSGFNQALNERKELLAKQVDVMEAVNQIASLSDWDYALAIRDTIIKICYCRPSPNYETFMSLSKLAIEALKSGVDPSVVLGYFDTMLYMERGGER
jgi:hypothetical protein